jgi:hypothetical protein
LGKWLCTETFTKKKTVLSYEGMTQNMETEFSKITDHFNMELDRSKLAKIVSKITKEEVKMKTGHDPQVVQLQNRYAEQRVQFRERHGSHVWETLFFQREFLASFLPPPQNLWVEG